MTAFKQVFGKAEYLLLFLVSMTLILTSAVIVKNLPILGQIVNTDTLSVWQKLLFFSSFFSSLQTVFGFFGTVLLVIVAFLFALNLTLLVFYIRKIKSILKGNRRIHAVGIGGLISGLLGIGCAACGSIVLTAILSSIGASGLLLFLPLHGSEFSFFGIILLCISIFVLAKRIQKPIVC